MYPDDRAASVVACLEAVVAAAAGVHAGRRAMRFLAGDASVIRVVLSWTVTDMGGPGEQCAIE